jgi:hypothetical protein
MLDGHLASPNRQNKPDDLEVNAMDAILFLIKFVGLSIGYFALMAAGRYLLGRFENPPRALIDAVDKLAGTHVGRLRFLVFAGAVSFVLAMVYPGPALLIDVPETIESARGFWYPLLHGTNASQHYVPKPSPPPSTWFWGQAALLYVGIFALYVVLALPNVLTAAFQAAKSAWERKPKDSNSRTVSLLWGVVVAFIGSYLAALWAESRKK